MSAASPCAEGTKACTIEKKRPFGQINPAIADFITAVFNAYKKTLTHATYGGVDRIAVKNKRKQALLLELDRSSDLFNASYAGIDGWIVGAGMEIMRERVNTNAELDAPCNLRAFSRGESGGVTLAFRLASPGRVRNKAIEYSLDSGRW